MLASWWWPSTNISGGVAAAFEDSGVRTGGLHSRRPIYGTEPTWQLGARGGAINNFRIERRLDCSSRVRMEWDYLSVEPSLLCGELCGKQPACWYQQKKAGGSPVESTSDRWGGSKCFWSDQDCKFLQLWIWVGNQCDHGGRGRPVSVPSMPSVPTSCRVMAIRRYWWPPTDQAKRQLPR